MRALIVAHDHVSPPGDLGERLRERGYEVEEHVVVPVEHHARPGVPARFPAFADHDVVVLMGAPWSVYDEERVGSWVAPELDEIRSARESGTPVLGICFGGQLLAAAHGGAVVLAERPEVGWWDVESRRDEVVPSGPWFQWHLDRWDLPPGAEELASNAQASQAFTLGRHLAVQFHPELTGAMLRGWIDNGGGALLRARGIDVPRLVAETEAVAVRSRGRVRALVDGFLDHVASADA